MQFEIEESSVVAATIVEGLLTKIGRRIPELESDASPGLFHLPWLSFHLGLRWGAWCDQRSAGISFRHIYDLRATFSSRMNAAGVPEVLVEQLLGHTGGLTQVYAKAIDEFRRAAIKKLEEYVRARPSIPSEQKTGGYIQ
jgi:integrase